MPGKSDRPSVMIVDDVAENLQVLSAMLEQDGFLVRPVPNGQMVLRAVLSEPPDIILLDIMMPDMDGFQVCRALKLHAQTREIPVLFISALSETFDKVKAFQEGGVDYITKPFQFEEVRMRVRTHLDLNRLHRENRALLAKTLMATARSLVEMLADVNPVMFDQANRLLRAMKLAAGHFKVAPETALQWEIAAMLSQLGCLGLPEPLLKRRQQGEFLDVRETEEYQRHAAGAADWIGGIPRMELAAEMIRRQFDPFSPDSGLDFLPEGCDPQTLGTHVLRVLVEFEHLQAGGRSSVGALLAMQEHPALYSPELLEALRMIVEEDGREKMEWVMLSDLRPDMILMEDIQDETGKTVLHRTSELTPNLLRLLGYYAMKQKILQPVAVLCGSSSADPRTEVTGDQTKTTGYPGFILGELMVDWTSCMVKLKNELIHLTATEYKILETLCRQQGKVLSRAQIADGALGIMFEGYDRTIDAHIKNIRQKMSAAAPECNYIQTVRGIGYKLARIS